MGEPLYLSVIAALKGSKFDAVTISSGRYGLGSKDTTPAQVKAVCTGQLHSKMITRLVHNRHQ